MPLIIRDSSERTKAISRPFWAVVVAVVMIVVGALWWVGAEGRYRHVINTSSTPIGSTLTFSQSDAELTLAGIYTDINRDVMVARFTPGRTAQENLPYRGDDFAVFTQSKAYRNKKGEEVSTLFGKMGTDGDYFLIVPNPTKDVYSYVLVNKRPTAMSGTDVLNGINDATRRQNSGDRSAADEESVSEALSQFNATADPDDQPEKNQQARARYDMAQLRLTLNPSIDSPEYQPTVIPRPLIGDNNQFRFDVIFNDVLKNQAVRSLTETYNKQQEAVRQLKDEVKAAQERLRANPRDSVAKANLDQTQKALQSAQKDIDTVVADLTRYESLEYDPAMFQNFQTTALVPNN